MRRAPLPSDEQRSWDVVAVSVCVLIVILVLYLTFDIWYPHGMFE